MGARLAIDLVHVSADGPLRVALDARDLNRAHLRGMGRYTWELLRHMVAEPGITFQLYGDSPDLPVHTPQSDRIAVEVFAWRGFRWHLWEQVGLPLRSRGFDLMHCPSMRAPYWQPAPTVVTIHDTIPWDGNESGWGRGFYTDRLTPAAFKKSAAVITGTAISGKDIVRHWPDLADRIHVIHHGVGDHYLEASPSRLPGALSALGVREPYLLYFGGEIPRKRFDWALDVFLQCVDESLGFAACGVSSAARDECLRRVPESLRSRVWLLPFVAEADVPALYQNAIALLYPTLHEGFGLPALEAQAVGTPAVFSPVSSLPELAGPGAVLVPPTDQAGWIAVVQRLVQERRAAPNPRPEARAWARQFSWTKAASQTLAVYRQAARQR